MTFFLNQCHSKVGKSEEQTIAQNTGQSGVFWIISTALTKTERARDGLLYFIGKLCNYVSGKLEYKLQAAVTVFCWYIFNLSKKTVVKNEKKIHF